jgi:hypothetical protein
LPPECQGPNGPAGKTPANARDPAFQDQLMDQLAALTGIALF